ncbi:MAG: helix-turn-helix domain-containing protein [Thermosynechococcaceae cyanobacterium]
MLTLPIQIGLIQYPGAMLSAVQGLQDLFCLANYICEQNGSNRRFSSIVYAPDQHTQRWELPLNEQEAALQVLIVPPRMDGETYLSPDQVLKAWICQHHKQGAIICSACAGTFVLAATGLLDHRRATTHWDLVSQFKERYPNTTLEVNQLLINDGDIITAGGLMSWIDLGLELVGQFMHPKIMRQLGKYMIVDTGQREQRYYQSFIPKLDHGDTEIIQVQHFIQAHLDEALSVHSLLAQCFLSERTFLRRFFKATTLTPKQYIQKVRIQRACELIESTNETFELISQQVGYIDNSAFRKTFIKIIGLTPREFRNRFASREQTFLQSL